MAADVNTMTARIVGTIRALEGEVPGEDLVAVDIARDTRLAAGLLDVLVDAGRLSAEDRDEVLRQVPEQLYFARYA